MIVSMGLCEVAPILKTAFTLRLSTQKSNRFQPNTIAIGLALQTSHQLE